ncbi:PEP/pyruvate-binding domain-containing protein [Sinosporangium siamense]|uniref:Phosphoenolpyruvate synthase n=1 Tax=Sinosporangium siamense TaxID=1367973 RepID=A0A919RLH9_9ACTN|nr:PEP/pyruvate-binding domain-containing protein [Sinosporangium siamense]GII95783.1 phosphoenolpyruvate synthase [Sinosporangium siamense]
MSDALVLKFHDIPDAGAGMLALVGGKAANLGILTRAGFPVPPGLCITTEAYRRIAELAGLDEVIEALARVSATDLPTLNQLAQKARGLVEAVPVPEDIATAVRANVHGPVAVRSSATAEDLPHASFAGQQDTFLNVVGPDAVLEAVRRCWASLWTDRAVTYRTANGIDHSAVRLAVVIQDMVHAEIAGVMFTANPVTGTRTQAVIDAASGLGEAVVSGEVNPDHFVVDKPSGRVKERSLGDKLVTIRSLAGGGTERTSAGSPGSAEAKPCITDAQLAALARLGANVEKRYGAPQDIEWAIDADGTLWLTQTRPITTLFPLPPNAPDNDLRVYFCASVAQGLQRPLTPMGISAFRLISSTPARLIGIPVPDPMKGAPIFTEAGDRLFVDITGIMRSHVGREILPRLLDVMEARTARILRGLFPDPRLSLTLRSPLPFLRRITRIALTIGLPALAVQALLNPATAHRNAARVEAALRVRLAPPDEATPAQRLKHAEHALGAGVLTVPKIAPSAIVGFAMLGLANWLLKNIAKPGEIQTVLRGVPHNVTTEMDLALWQLAEDIRKHPQAMKLMLETSVSTLAERYREGSLPPAVADGLASFLRKYGHRAVAEIDLGLPRWSEEPDHIIGVLANYLRLTDPDAAPDVQFARGATEARRTIKDLSRRAGGLRGGLVRFALGRARALVGLRELPKFLMVTVLGVAREQIRLIGVDFAKRGLISKADDVFFLTLPDIRAAVAEPDTAPDLRSLVTTRRESYERELGRRHTPRILLSDGTEPEAVADAHMVAVAGALTGTSASAGTVTGVARVILDPTGAYLEPGEILVCPSTDPGWTPLFLTAGGLVMEMGGANSHGAVVAREYGIPAVVGATGATEHITTGQLITVDGTSGVVLTAQET